MYDSFQVIMALVQLDAQAVPSGRGVATHGAPLPDGNIEAKIKDSTPTWRSVLSTGEVAQAYKYAINFTYIAFISQLQLLIYMQEALCPCRFR